MSNRNLETPVRPQSGADVRTAPSQKPAAAKPPVGWLILLFIPMVGYITFLYMGREAKRDSWHRLGMIFGWAAWIGLILYWALISTAGFSLLPFLILLYAVRASIGAIAWGGFKKIYAFSGQISNCAKIN